MIKKLIYFTFVILVLSSVSAEDLSDFPNMLIDHGTFDGYFVVGNKAPSSHVIAQSKLALFFGEITGQPIIGKTKLASDMVSLESNLIMIGNPCENELLDLLNNYPIKCSTLLNSGIHYAEYENYNHIIISGSDSEIKEGVDLLINYEDNDLKGDTLSIESNNEIDDLEEKIAPIKEKINDTQLIIDELTRKIANKTSEIKENPKIEQIKNISNSTINKIQEIEINPIEIKGNGFFGRIWGWIKSIFN